MIYPCHVFDSVLISLSFFMLLDCKHLQLSFNVMYLNCFSCMLFVYTFFFLQKKKKKKKILECDTLQNVNELVALLKNILITVYIYQLMTVAFH